MTIQTLPPRPPDPSQAPPPVRTHARTKATRLLSAGTYLHPGYRRSVIRELLKNRFRVVAPSYGYDAVSVLAHALAARRLRRIQLGVAIGSAVLVPILIGNGALSVLVGVPLLCWILWAVAYLRRIVTLYLLMSRLKGVVPDDGFDGSYPANKKLTPALIRKIDSEQSASDGLVFYGGFRPFVGAGELVRDWHSPQLLIGRPLTKTVADTVTSAMGPDPETVQRKPIIPFGADDITSFVAGRLAAALRDEALPDERIEGLTVERRHFTTAIRTNDRTRGPGWSRLPGMDDLPDVHWREDYDSAREYLCVRIGSWNEELVTSVFIGFDVKGNTLHTEFYTYVLGPLIGEFHLVDQLPEAFDWRLAVRVAWDMVKALPRWVLRIWLLPLWVVPRRLLPPRLRALVHRQRRGSGGLRIDERIAAADTSEFRLGRYVTKAVDCGALMSVREMATNDSYHHFFQKSDAVKYKQIIERRLLQIMRTFLYEHNVDLADHDRAQTNILNLGANSQNIFGGRNESIEYSYAPAAAAPAGDQGDQGAQPT